MKQTMADLIEEYIKELLNNESSATVKRVDIASHFNCVPSQVNYVINTRFNDNCGYEVVSKRGGGGYIKIKRAVYSGDADCIYSICDSLSDTITEVESKQILNDLLKRGIVNNQTYNVINNLMKINFYKNNILETLDSNKLRSVILRQSLLALARQ